MKALIVDDDAVFRSVLQRSLEKREITVLVAENPRQAVELFRDGRPELVLLDYRMPERDGLSLLRELRGYDPGAVILMLTGFGNIPLAVDAMKQGADSFLTKPVDVDTILSETQKIREKKRNGPAAIPQWEQRFFNLDILERAGIEKALEATGGNVSQAAQLLGIDRRTLQRKLKRYFQWFVLLAGVAAGSVSSSAFATNAKQTENQKWNSARDKFINLTGDADYADDRSAWDKTFSREEYVFGKDPVKFLAESIERLPKGRVLDLAMGEGRNAVFLAKKGFVVEGVDISRVGIRKAQALAAENGVSIETINADLNDYRIKPLTYNVITNFYYYQPSLLPQIKNGLAVGGVVVYEGYTTEQLKNPGKDKISEKLLLKPGELRNLFSDFEIVHYAELNDGESAVARLIARRPKSWQP